MTTTYTISEIRNVFRKKNEFSQSQFQNFTRLQFHNFEISRSQNFTVRLSQFLTFVQILIIFLTISQLQTFTISRFHNIISQFYFTTLLPRMISITHFNPRTGFQFEVEIGGDIHR